jgi:hypothetical protein
MHELMTEEHCPSKRSLTTPFPPPRRRQPGGVLHDEDEKEDPTNGGPKDKTWLSKIGAAFGAVGNPSHATSAAGALGSEVEPEEKNSEIEASEVIEHHQKKKSSAHFEEEATVMMLPSKQKREDSLPNANEASLVNSGHGSDNKEVLVRDDIYYSIMFCSCSCIFVGTVASCVNPNRTKNSRTRRTDGRRSESFLGQSSDSETAGEQITVRLSTHSDVDSNSLSLPLMCLAAPFCR